VKTEVFEAIKTFEKKVKNIIPDAKAKVIETFDDADASLMVIIPDLKLIHELVDLKLKIEKETGVTLSILPTTRASK
jgi:hypothetical protein